jgi:hypothetical protein
VREVEANLCLVCCVRTLLGGLGFGLGLGLGYVYEFCESLCVFVILIIGNGFLVSFTSECRHIISKPP